MHSHESQRHEQKDEVTPVEADRAHDHDGDLEELDEPYQPGFFELVGDLARSCGEKHERGDEHCGGNVDQIIRRQRRQCRGLESDEDHQRVLVDVVVPGSQKLGPEEGRKAALAQKLKLAALGAAVRLRGFIHAT